MQFKAWVKLLILVRDPEGKTPETCWGLQKFVIKVRLANEL